MRIIFVLHSRLRERGYGRALRASITGQRSCCIARVDDAIGQYREGVAASRGAIIADCRQRQTAAGKMHHVARAKLCHGVHDCRPTVRPKCSSSSAPREQDAILAAAGSSPGLVDRDGALPQRLVFALGVCALKSAHFVAAGRRALVPRPAGAGSLRALDHERHLRRQRRAGSEAPHPDTTLKVSSLIRKSTSHLFHPPASPFPFPYVGFPLRFPRALPLPPPEGEGDGGSARAAPPPHPSSPTRRPWCLQTPGALERARRALFSGCGVSWAAS